MVIRYFVFVCCILDLFIFVYVLKFVYNNKYRFILEKLYICIVLDDDNCRSLG